MPTPRIQSGLPAIPAGLPETQARLLTPIYLAFNGLAAKVSAATGLMEYSTGEQAQINQAETLIAGNANVIYLKATEAIAWGQMCNMHLDGGKLSARLATSTSPALPAVCVCDAEFGLVAGEFGKFIFFTGYTAGIAGTTIGSIYYLGAAGNSQLARPAGAGTIVQAVGVGLGSLGFYTQISSYFQQN